MRAAQPSPFDTLEACFGLLTTGPAPMALDGRQLGHGLPARRIPLSELRILLHHPSASDGLQLAILQELVRLAIQHRGHWTIGLGGVLLPGLRNIAKSARPIDLEMRSHVETDVLERFCNAIRQPGPETAEFAITILRLARSHRRSARAPHPPP